jgi:predicted HTH transcriptional regulator
MSKVFDGNIEATELLLRIILERKDVKVVRVKGQVELKSPYPGGRNIKLDIDAVTERKNRVSLRKGLTKNQEQVLDYLKNNPMATLQEAASGCELSLGGVKKICSKLQEIGVLGREGSKRDGRWIVK